MLGNLNLWGLGTFKIHRELTLDWVLQTMMKTLEEMGFERVGYLRKR